MTQLLTECFIKSKQWMLCTELIQLSIHIKLGVLPTFLLCHLQLIQKNGQSLSFTKSCFFNLPNNLHEGRKCSSLVLTCFMYWLHILIYYTFLSEISYTFQSDLHRDHWLTESEPLFINCQEERNKSQSQLHCFPWLLSTKFQINWT